MAARAQIETLLAAKKLMQSRDADHDTPILARIQRAVAISTAAMNEAVGILKSQGFAG